jgi:hypothetical protein
MAMEVDKTATVVAWRDLFERSRAARDPALKWGPTLQCTVRNTARALVTLHTTQQLVALCQARCVPFFVQHQRKLDGRYFTGLVTQAYSRNGQLAFKVLYPYSVDHYYEGTLYDTLSGAACTMYADYNREKMAAERQDTPFVRKANSNGWCHLLVEVNCPSDRCDDHSPYQFLRHMEDVFPRKLRERLAHSLPCEFNLAVLPPAVVVPHDLDLGHLMDERKVARAALSPKDLHRVDSVAGMLRTLVTRYVERVFPDAACRGLVIDALNAARAHPTFCKSHAVFLRELHGMLGEEAVVSTARPRRAELPDPQPVGAAPTRPSRTKRRRGVDQWADECDVMLDGLLDGL